MSAAGTMAYVYARISGSGSRATYDSENRPVSLFLSSSPSFSFTDLPAPPDFSRELSSFAVYHRRGFGFAHESRMNELVRMSDRQRSRNPCAIKSDYISASK